MPKNAAFNLNDLNDYLYHEYNAPKVPPDFPKEIGVVLYNLAPSDKLAVREFIWKYLDEEYPPKHIHLLNLDLDPEESYTNASYLPDWLDINDYLDLLELKPTIDRAIKGENPTDEDQKSLNKYLLDIQYIAGKPGTWQEQENFDPYELLPKGKGGRTVIKEITSEGKDGRLRWKIYKWIYYTWALAIEIKRCTCGCNKIFLKDDRQKYHPECAKRIKKEADNQSKQADRIDKYKEQAKWIAEWAENVLGEEFEAWKISTELPEYIRKQHQRQVTDFSTGKKVGLILKHVKPYLKEQGFNYDIQKTKQQNTYVFYKI